MKIFVLITVFATLAQSNEVKITAKRAILGHGHIETAQNSIANPNKNAYLPPPIQEYAVEQSQFAQQSAILNQEIEPPVSPYLPPFEASATYFGATQNAFVPVKTALGSSTSHNLQYASQYRASGYLPPHHDHERDQLAHQLPRQSNYRAPDYLPPSANQPADHGITSQVSIASHSREPEYLPPDNHLQHNVENSQPAYNPAGYLPPLSPQESNGNGLVEQPSEGNSRTAGYLPPYKTNAEHVNPILQVPTPTHASYNAPGYLPPLSHQSVSAHVAPSVDFEQHNAYKAAGYLPPVGGPSNYEHSQLNSYNGNHQHSNQKAQVPHTVYGTPKSHSHTSMYVSPAAHTAVVSLATQYAPSNSNTYTGNTANSHAAQYSSSAQGNYDRHQHDVDEHHQYHHQSHIHNSAQQPGVPYSVQTQAYAPKYAPHPGLQTTSQSTGVPVPNENTATSPMYSPNPITQYAAEAPTYQTNNEYLPPHPDLMPSSHHHPNQNNKAVYQISAAGDHTNNGYLPPVQTEHISGEHSGNNIQFLSNTGAASSQEQYASSFPTYSNNRDGYDYSRPKGASFEDGHNTLYHNAIEAQPDLHVINVGSEGGYQQEIKIIRIIDETTHGALPNIRTLKIIKETVPGEPNHSGVQIIKIISDPSSSQQLSAHVSNPNINVPHVPNHINIPQAAEQIQVNNLQALRSESAGENVEGGYLPPPVLLQPPVAQPPAITSSVPQTEIQHHQHVSHDHHSQIPSTVPNLHSPISDLRQPSSVPGYLPPLLPNVPEIRPPGQSQPYLPPAHSPTSNVKILRILHDSNFDQQQDAIYAGVAEENTNEVNTIRVIHQQEAATTGRYGYPSPDINSVKLLRYYKRY